MVSKAATPAPFIKSEISKQLKYEKFYGQKRETPSSPVNQKTPCLAAAKETNDLNNRLIKVLREEENLCLQAKPFIRKYYFQELYQSERGKALMKFGALIDTSDLDDCIKNASSATDIEQAEREEQSFMKEQRMSQK